MEHNASHPLDVGYENYFRDPYSADWVKYVALIIYIIGLPGCVFGVSFAAFQTSEISGFKGNSISNFQAMNVLVVSTNNLLLSGFDLFRIWMGPLPPQICQAFNTFRLAIYLSVQMFACSTSVMKFLIICVWKGFPESVNLDLISKLISKIIFVTAFILSLAATLYSNKPILSQVNMKY